MEKVPGANLGSGLWVLLVLGSGTDGTRQRFRHMPGRPGWTRGWSVHDGTREWAWHSRRWMRCHCRLCRDSKRTRWTQNDSRVFWKRNIDFCMISLSVGHDLDYQLPLLLTTVLRSAGTPARVPHKTRPWPNSSSRDALILVACIHPSASVHVSAFPSLCQTKPHHNSCWRQHLARVYTGVR